MKIKYNRYIIHQKPYLKNCGYRFVFYERLVKRVKNVGVSGYRRKTKEQLLKEIDACKSLSQLFALIQHEGIVMRMYSQPGASNLTPKKLYPKEIINNKEDTPLERLRLRVRKAVEQYDERVPSSSCPDNPNGKK